MENELINGEIVAAALNLARAVFAVFVGYVLGKNVGYAAGLKDGAKFLKK